MSKKKLAGIIIGSIIGLVIIIAIIEAVVTSAHTYTLSVSVNPSGAGSISPSGGKYKSGDEVTLIASPAGGYIFDYWSGGASDTASTITVTMDSDKSLTGNFEAIPSHDLSIDVIGQGTINPSIGTHKYGNGTKVTVTASPASGWKFDHWGGDVSGTSTIVIITIDSDKDITAYFEKVPEVVYRITGTASTVDVTLNNAQGGTEQYNNVYLPKEYSYDSFSDDFVYISAQNQGEYGTVTVEIYVNGSLFKTSTSSGAYVIATASGLK